jgi:cytoskeletal protein RodZ
MPFDLERIGRLLREAREEKGLTVEEVSGVLFIRKSMISALEAADWSSLPHDVYVRGYVTQYAAFLRILPQISACLTLQTAIPAIQEIIPKKEEKIGWRLSVPTKKAMGAIGMAAVVIAFLVFQNTHRPAYVAPAPRSVPNTYQTISKNVPSQPVSPGYQAAADRSFVGEEQLLSEPKNLLITCFERTWVRVIIDGTEEKEFTMKPEEKVLLNAKQSFDLLIGNAGGVRLFYNGQDTGFTGDDGEVKRVNFS